MDKDVPLFTCVYVILSLNMPICKPVLYILLYPLNID